jgi:hypothetical protein
MSKRLLSSCNKSCHSTRQINLLTGVLPQIVDAPERVGQVGFESCARSSMREREVLCHRFNFLICSALMGKVPELDMCGDCVAPRRLYDAIYDGTRVGRRT